MIEDTKSKIVFLYKSTSLLVRFDLIIYVSAAGMPIDHIGLLKAYFAGTFHKESQIRLLKVFGS